MVNGNFENSKTFENLVILNKKRRKKRQPQSYLSSVLFHLVASRLALSRLSSSLLLSLVLLSLCLRVLLCVVLYCCSVLLWCVWCVWCVVCGVCGVWCGTLEKLPCVDSKRPRVYRHQAHMCYHMRAWCQYTRGRFESRHGGVLNLHTGEGVTVSSAHRNLPTQGNHVPQRFTERNPWILHIFSLRVGREQHVPESSNHSLYLMKLLSSS